MGVCVLHNVWGVAWLILVPCSALFCYDIIFLVALLANVNFRSDLVGIVTDEDRRNIRNRERAFVRESARANESEGTGGVDQGGVVYRDTESGPQTINFQQAVEQTEEGGALQDDTAEEAGDKESNRGGKEGNHGDKEGSQPAESKEEEVGTNGCGRWRGDGCGRWRGDGCGRWRGDGCGRWRGDGCGRWRGDGCGR